jgi:hypothetical protein
LYRAENGWKGVKDRQKVVHAHRLGRETHASASLKAEDIEGKANKNPRRLSLIFWSHRDSLAWNVILEMAAS